ncbi:hypothetical protein [Arenibacter sp. S6351L]|uniref:hypothetical protein n=1 Tax=Arenibacter sp. S6351L TaxID=2926407 RepID=UPI001FF27650|nr:hypothetical protein [Arenibacter sp. S6351L]MCK0137352.1 hypothetical protein [Arenibacter sp. S6351L]
MGVYIIKELDVVFERANLIGRTPDWILNYEIKADNTIFLNSNCKINDTEFQHVHIPRKIHDYIYGEICKLKELTMPNIENGVYITIID